MRVTDMQLVNSLKVPLVTSEPKKYVRMLGTLTNVMPAKYITPSWNMISRISLLDIRENRGNPLILQVLKTVRTKMNNS